MDFNVSTAAPSPVPAPQGWQETRYNYTGAQPHAVTSLTSDQSAVFSGEYDANGNMTCRVENGVTYRQNYNAENRISSIARINGLCSNPGAEILEVWAFAYDGDGTRVSTAHYTGLNPTPDSISAYYMGGAYEVTGGAVRKYYAFAGQTIAMRDGTGLQYLLTDHLGSVVAVTNANGTLTSQQRYLPFGQVRTDLNPPYITQTDFTYTGQRNLPDTGLMDYDARFYSAALGRFIQPDNIVPNPLNPQNFNRFSYVRNNPSRYTDPSGHKPCNDVDERGNCIPEDPQALLKYIARRKGIHIAPGDHWQFEDFLSHEPGGDSVWGYTPRNPDLYPYDEKYYFDRNGNIHFVDDSAVYITSATFRGCKYDFDCIGMIMAHEAGHSWIESIVEGGTPKSPQTVVDRGVEAAGEEGFVNSALMLSPQIPDSLKDSELVPRIDAADADMEFWIKGDSSSVLEYFYRIDLTPSDLFKLIYGKNPP